MKLYLGRSRKWIFVLLLCVIGYFLYSEEIKANELEGQIHKLEGIALLNAYTVLAAHYQELDPVLSQKYANLIISYVNTGKFSRLNIEVLSRYLYSAYYAKGISYLIQEDYYKASEYLFRAKIWLDNGTQSADIYYYIALCHQKLGEYQGALDNYHNCLQYFSSLSLGLEHDLYFNLAKVYEETGRSSEALEYYQRLIDFEGMASGTHNHLLAEAHLNTGMILSRLSQFSKAREHYLIALGLEEKNRESQLISTILIELGKLEWQFDINRADSYFAEALDLFTENQKEQYLHTLIQYLDLQIEKVSDSDYRLFLDRVQKVQEEAELASFPDIGLLCYNILVKLYSHLHDEESAYQMLRRYYTLSDSIQNSNFLLKTEKMKRTVQHKSDLDRILQEKNDYMNLRLQMDRKCTLNYILIIVSLPFAAICVVLFIAYRSKKRYLERLRKINHDITETTQELNRQIKELNDFRDNLKNQYETAIDEVRNKDNILIVQSRYVALSDLIENISVQWKKNLSYIKENIDKVVQLHKDNLINRENLDEIIKNSMKILYDMSQKIEDFRNFFRPHENHSSFTVYDIISKVIQFIKDHYANNNISIISSDIEDDLFIEGYPNEMALIFLNILNNSQQAFFRTEVEDATITIKAKRSFDRIIIEIRDNAGGIGHDNLEEVFDPFYTTKENPNASGLGLYIAREIVTRRFKGKITLKNVEGGLLAKIII